MTLAALRAFHAVAMHRSFTRASRVSGLAQPTLSTQVKQLELAHEAALFDRRGRGGILLTPLGARLFEVTTRLFAAEDEARALLDGMRTLRRGHLRIAADSAAHVMPALAEMKRDHPGLTFSLTSANSSQVLEQVTDLSADIGISARPVSDPRLHSVVLKRDCIVLFMRADHPLAHEPRVTLDMLERAEFVIRERGSITREVFEARLSEAGVTPHSLMEVEGREAVREAVAAGFGIGIVFKSEFVDDRGFAAVPIADADLSVAEYAVCLARRAKLPMMRLFFGVISTLEERKAEEEALRREVQRLEKSRAAEALIAGEQARGDRRSGRKAPSHRPRARVIG